MKITNLDVKRQKLGLNKHLNSYEILSIYRSSNTKKKIEILSVIEVVKFNENIYQESLNLIFRLEKVKTSIELIRKLSEQEVKVEKIIRNKKEEVKIFKSDIEEVEKKSKYLKILGTSVFAIIIIFIISEFSSTELDSIKTEKSIKLKTMYGQKFIDVNVNGIKSQFLIDTGASDLLVPREFLTSLIKSNYINRRFHFMRYQNYLIADGSLINAEVWRIPEISIGNFNISNVEVAVVENGSYLFGMSALNKLGNVSIDLENNRIIIE